MSMNKNRFWRGLKKGLMYFIAIFAAMVTFFPLIVTFLSSLKTNEEILLGMFSWPKVWNFGNYPEAVRAANAFKAIGNSLFVAIATLAVTVIIAMPGAYAIARKNYSYLKAVYILFMAGVMVPVHCTLVSVTKISSALGTKNSYIFLILIYTAFNLSQAVFLFTGYISSLDKGLDEAAKIDGASRMKIYRSVVLPLLKPTVVTLVIIDSLAIWNDYLLPSLVLVKKELYTLPIAAQSFHGDFSSDYGLMMAGMVMSVIPILILYFILQKHIIEGVVAGAVKG